MRAGDIHKSQRLDTEGEDIGFLVAWYQLRIDGKQTLSGSLFAPAQR